MRWFKTISRPEKSREIHVKHAYNITIIFYMCLISPISCVRLINEWQSVDRSQSRVACRDFLELWLLKKKPEKFVFLADNVFFILSLIANALYDFFLADCETYNFIF